MILDFCLKVMLNTQQLIKLGESKLGISLKGNKTSIIEGLKENGINLSYIRSFCRESHKRANLDLIRKVLKSGKLKGHSWERARPSNLHLSIQNLVRDCFAEKIDIDEYLEKGNNIIKHEFFITAIHDLAEQTIIDNFDDVIPAITSKSTIDFVYNGVPYDLKVTPPLKEWTYEEAKNDPIGFAKSLYEGQDTERVRASAKEVGEFNRLFLVYKDDSIWENPEDVEKKIKELFSRRPQPLTVTTDGKQIKVLVVFLE